MISRRDVLTSSVASLLFPNRKRKHVVWSNQQTDKLVFPPGATSGQRLEISKNGILIYNTNNKLVYAAVPGAPAAVAGLTNGGIPVINGGDSNNQGQIIWDDIDGTGQFVFDSIAGTFFATGQWDSTVTDTSIGGSINGIRIARIPFVVGAKSTFRFGSGFDGAYLYEEASFNGSALPNNASTNLTPNSVDSATSDYASGWAGSTWTAPIAGIFNITTWVVFTGTANGQNQLLRILHNGVIRGGDDTLPASAGSRKEATARIKLAANDTIQIQAFQTSGAAINLGAGSYASIQRVL